MDSFGVAGEVPVAVVVHGGEDVVEGAGEAGVFLCGWSGVEGEDVHGDGSGILCWRL